MKEYNDLPAEKIIKLAEKLISKGWTIRVKWVCESCNDRVTCNTPNAFFTEGYRHDDCGHTSFPVRFGLMVEKKLK